MFYKKIFCDSLFLIVAFSVVGCSSGLYFESEVHLTNESGFPIPEVFEAEDETQSAPIVGNQFLINLLMLIAFGLVSLILVLLLGRR